MLILINNRIGGVMVRVRASNAVDRGFEPRAAKTKDYKIGMCCFTAKHTRIIKEKDQRLGIRIYHAHSRRAR